MADSATYDLATIQRRQKIAEQMLADSSKPPKIEHWAQGLAYLGNVGADSYNLNRLDKQAGEAKKRDRDALMTLLGGGAPDAAPAAPAPTPAAPVPAAPVGDGAMALGPNGKPLLDVDGGIMPPGSAPAVAVGPGYDRAIAGIESGGEKNPYGAIGQPTRTGARAIGKYQVMDFNVPTWTKEILGKEMTPQQFAASPEAQEAVFKGKFGQYVQQTGSPQDAASMWFTGKPLAEGANRRAMTPAGVPFGPNGQQYVDKFTKNLSGPDAVASAMTPGAAPMAFSPDVAGQPAPGAPAPAPVTGSAAVAQAMTPTTGKTAIGNGGSLVNIPPAQRAAIASGLSADPGTPAHAVAMAMLTSAIKPQEFGFQTLPDGTILRTDPRGGTVAPIYQAATKPSFSVIGKDQNGNDVHGFVDANTRKTFDINGNPTDTSKLAGLGGSPDSNLTGDAFLKTLDPGRANQIKAIADGRMSPPGGMSLKSPQIQGLMRDVAQYEPGFDLTSWTARNKTRADLSSGKMGQNVTAFNTAIGHLETLDKAAESLNNSWSPAFNKVANLVIDQKGDPRVKAFEVARTAVADELTRAFRGSGGNVHDLVQWESAINSAGSPAQLKAAIKQAVDLLHSRITAVGDQYSRGMGKTTDPIELLSPKAQAGIKKLLGEKTETTPSETPAGKTSTNVEWSIVK